MSRLRQKITNLIVWSERFAKTDMRYVIKGGSWLSLSHFVTAVSGLLTAVAFANLVDPGVYGTYQYVIAAAAFLGAFTLTGMHIAVAQSVAKGFSGALQQGFSLKLAWNAIPALLAAAIAIYYYIQADATLAMTFLIMAIAMPIMLAATLYSAFLEGQQHFKIASQLNIFRTVTVTIALVACIYYTEHIVFIVLTFFTAQLVTSLISYVFTLKVHRPEKSTDPSLSGYSKHLSLMNLLGQAATHIDKILIFQFVGVVEVAIYSFALALPKELSNMNKIISTLALPKLASSKTPAAYARMGLISKMKRLFVLSTIITLGYILMAPTIYSALFPKYTDSIFYSQLLSLILLFTPAILMKQYFVALKKTRTLYVLNICKPLYKIIFLAVLLPIHGILGAVFAIIISLLLYTLTMLALFLKTKH